MKLTKNVTALVLAAGLSALIPMVVSKSLGPPIESGKALRETAIAPRLPFCSNRTLKPGEIKRVCVAKNDIFLLALLALTEAQANRHP